MRKFTEYLRDLARLSDRIDAGTVTDDDYTQYQRMAISEAYKAGDLTSDEYRAVNGVYYALELRLRAAMGLLMPTPWETYTRDKWLSDGHFEALPGQPVERSIYEDMLISSIRELSPVEMRSVYERYGIALSSGFVSGDSGSFGRSGAKYYYLGAMFKA